MDIKKLSFLYNISENKLLNHKEYLDFDITENCCLYHPEPYISIQNNDYLSPIEHLKQYFRNISDNDILDQQILESTAINKKTLIKYDNNLETYIQRDQVILQYIMNRPKTFIMTIWPIAKEFINEIVLYLQENGIVSVIRKISLSYLGAQNLLDLLYNKIVLKKTSTERKLHFINTKLQYTEFNKNTMNDFYVIVFENINDLPISGTGAAFKTILRQEIMKIIKNKYPNKNVELSDTVHINDYFYESIEYAQIYFHEQTLIHLQKKNINNWFDNSMIPSFLRLNAIKKWQIKNLNSIESQRLILLTGSSFFTMGIRKSSDIDSIFINIESEEERENEIIELIYKDFFNEETKIPFADSGMSGTKAWKDSWTTKNQEFYSSFEYPLTDFVITMNPKLFYYWNGLKIMSFEMTIQFKLYRYIPSDYVDFIILKELYPDIAVTDIKVDKNLIWEHKKHRSIKTINELITKSFERYLPHDKRRINIKKYIL